MNFYITTTVPFTDIFDDYVSELPKVNTLPTLGSPCPLGRGKEHSCLGGDKLTDFLRGKKQVLEQIEYARN